MLSSKPYKTLDDYQRESRRKERERCLALVNALSGPKVQLEGESLKKLLSQAIRKGWTADHLKGAIAVAEEIAAPKSRRSSVTLNFRSRPRGF